MYVEFFQMIEVVFFHCTLLSYENWIQKKVKNGFSKKNLEDKQEMFYLKHIISPKCCYFRICVLQRIPEKKV